MKIKRAHIIVFSLLNINFFFINEIKSQYSIAGIHYPIYVDIISDTLLNPTPYPGGDEYYFLDINQDGNSDIKIQAHSAISPGATYQYVSISSLDTNTSFSLGSIDSTYIATSVCGNNFWITRPVLKIYDSGDTIKNAIYVSSGYLGYRNQMGSPSCFNAVSGQWIDSSDHYIGVRYFDTSGIAYGWIKVNVTNYWIALIKDFSLNITLSGIEQFSTANQLNIYPNPANNMVQISYMRNTQIQNITLHDVFGKEVMSTKEKNIDVSTLNEGIYFVRVKTSEGIFTEKIIIQHK